MASEPCKGTSQATFVAESVPGVLGAIPQSMPTQYAVETVLTLVHRSCPHSDPCSPTRVVDHFKMRFLTVDARVWMFAGLTT